MSAVASKIMPDFCNRRFPFHFTTALHLLRKLGINPRSIEILAVGRYENYKGEIRAQKPSPGTVLTPKDKIVLEVGCSSAIDLMPYQFFYGLAGITDRASDWEDNARHLMAPFDAAYVRYMGISSYEIMKYNFNFIDNNYLFKYLELYDFSGIDISDPSMAIRWLAIMPTFHIWAGNAERVSKILTFLFGFDFNINESLPACQNIPKELRYTLGSNKCRLGYEAIVGRSFTECETAYEVVISGIALDKVVELLPGKPMRRKIEAVLDYCMPGNLDYKFKIRAARDNFGQEPTEIKRYLGYNSFI